MKGKEALDTIYHELNQRHLDWYADEEVDNKIVDILRNELSKNYLTIKAELDKLEELQEEINKYRIILKEFTVKEACLLASQMKLLKLTGVIEAIDKLDRIKEVVEDEWEGRQMGSVLPKIKQIIEEEK